MPRYEAPLPGTGAGGINASLSAGNTSGTLALISSGTMYLAGGNNITLSQNGQSVTISGGAGGAGDPATTVSRVESANVVGTGTRYAREEHQHAGLWQQSVGGNTSGDTSAGAGSFVLAGGNNITLSGSTAAGGQTLTISAFNQSVQTQMTGLSAGVSTGGNSAGTTGIVSQRLVLRGGKGISLSQSIDAQSATITFEGVDPDHRIGMSTMGNTSGTSSVFSGENWRYFFAGGNNITLSQSVGGLTATLTISAFNQTAPVVSNAIQSVSTGTGSGTNTSRFAADDHVHAGVNRLGVSTLGNTLGSTTLLHARSVYLVGGNNVTLSQSTDANHDITVTISAAAGGAGGAPTLAFWNRMPVGISAPGHISNVGSISNATLWVFPLYAPYIGFFPGNMSVSTVLFQVSASTATSNSVAATLSMSFGIYTRANATALSSLFSASTTYAKASATSLGTQIHGVRWLSFNSSQFNAQPTLSQTEYYGALWVRTSGQALPVSTMGVRWGGSINLSGTFGAGSASANSLGDMPWLGFSTASFTTAMPSQIALSALAHTGSGMGMAIPHVVFNNVAGMV